MQITDILKSLKTQTFTILQKDKCSQVLFCNMLKTYFLVTKQLDALHSWNLIKSFQILLVLLVMSILTSSAYKYISLTLLITCFSLICYIITSEFIRLKTLYEDLRISCHLQEETPPSSNSSNWCMNPEALVIYPTFWVNILATGCPIKSDDGAKFGWHWALVCCT